MGKPKLWEVGDLPKVTQDTSGGGSQEWSELSLLFIVTWGVGTIPLCIYFRLAVFHQDARRYPFDQVNIWYVCTTHYSFVPGRHY